MASARVSIGDIEVLALSDGEDRIASPAGDFPGVPDEAWDRTGGPIRTCS